MSSPVCFSNCADCGIDTIEAEEWYMVHDQIWEQAWGHISRYVLPVADSPDDFLPEIKAEGKPAFCLTCDHRFDDIERDRPAALVVVTFTVGIFGSVFPLCRACYRSENELVARALQHHPRELWPWRAGRETRPDTDSNPALKHALVECFQRTANDLAPLPHRGREVVDAGVVFLFLSMLHEFWENFPDSSEPIMATFLRDLNRVVKRARQGRYDGDGREDSR